MLLRVATVRAAAVMAGLVLLAGLVPSEAFAKKSKRPAVQFFG